MTQKKSNIVNSQLKEKLDLELMELNTYIDSFANFQFGLDHLGNILQ
jgi:hypothetical protein